MKLLGLIAVIGIVFYLYKHRLEPSKDSVATAMAEADQVAPAAPAAASSAPAPAPATSNLRRPIDRTRNVLEQVKTRNGDGQF